MTTERKAPAKDAPVGVDPKTGEIAEGTNVPGSALVDAAKANGATEVEARALPLPMELAGIPQVRVSDVFPTPAKWEMYPQRDIDAIVDAELVIIDVMYFPSLTFEGKEWYICLAMDTADNEVFTFSNGGGIMLRKLHGLQEFEIHGEWKNLLPIRGKITKHASSTKGFHDYYDLI